jgi:hypothetical protein
MGNGTHIEVTLDAVGAAKLKRLAERVHGDEAALAACLLAQALDETDADPRITADVLDRIPDADTRAQLGRNQARASDTTPIDEL